jgi:UDP-2,3-diacylglucosamine hydrolase
VTPSPSKVGIVAGAGEMPLAIVRACERAGRPYFVVAVDEFAAPMGPNVPHARVGISKIGACMAALKANGCSDVVFAGKLQRPDGQRVKLRPDLGGLEFLVRLAGTLGRHDDSLHRAIAAMLTWRGMRVVSPLDVATNLAAKAGCLTRAQPAAALWATFGKALALAREHGATKQGQAVVVLDGEIVAREGRAGTDAMLTSLDRSDLGNGFLVKAMAPTQLPTIDPPAIGESTVDHAARAGLAGILIEANRSVIVDEERVRARADELGLFVCAETVDG